MPRREHVGAAAQTTLSAGIDAAALSFTVAAGGGTGYPTGAVGNFFIVLDLDAAAEEHVLCSSRATDTFTVASGGRGADDTTATSHASGATVNHGLAALEVDEHNRHLNDTALDEHTQYMLATGTRHDLTARHSVGTVVPAAVVVDVGTVNSEGVATTVARSDHVHGIANNAVGTTELNADSVTAAKIASGAVGTTELADDAVTSVKIADDAVTGGQVSAFAERIHHDIAVWGPISVDTDIATFTIASRVYRRVAYFTATINFTPETDQTGDILWQFRTAAGGLGTELSHAQTRQSTVISSLGSRASVALAGSIEVAANVAQDIVLRAVEVQGTIHIKSVTSPGNRPGDIDGIIVPIGTT